MRGEGGGGAIPTGPRVSTRGATTWRKWWSPRRPLQLRGWGSPQPKGDGNREGQCGVWIGLEWNR